MSLSQIVLATSCVAAAAYQLWRVPRAWAFLLLFIVLMPKLPLVGVPGNPTPIRVDDVVIAAVLAGWALRELFTVRLKPDTTVNPVRLKPDTTVNPVRLKPDTTVNPVRLKPDTTVNPVRLKPDTTGNQRDAAATSQSGESGFSRTIPPSPATLFLLAYWSAALVCTLLGIASLTTPPLTGVLHFARVIEYGLLYYFFYRSVRPDELEDAVQVFRFALLVVCGIWLAQHWTHAPVSGPPTNWATLYPTFSATYDFGGYLMVATVALYALWSTGGSRSVWTPVALLAGLYVTVNSDSRASLLGVALALVFDVVVRVRWRSALALGALGAAAPFVIDSKKMMGLIDAAVAIMMSLNFEIVQRAFATDPSLALRLRNWRLAVDHWVLRPLVGDGLGGYLRYTQQYGMPGTPDGWYIRVLADTGLIGLLAFVLLMAALLWTLLRAFQLETQPLRRAIVYGAALALVATSVSAILVDTFVSYKIMGVFWMIIGVGTRIAADGGRIGVAPDLGPAPPALLDLA